MEVRFADGELATLCCSAQGLQQRWGPDIGPALARQLVLLQAVPDVAALGTLPNFRSVPGTQDWLATIRGNLRLTLRLQHSDQPPARLAIMGIGGSSMLIIRRIEELQMASAE